MGPHAWQAQDRGGHGPAYTKVNDMKHTIIEPLANGTIRLDGELYREWSKCTRQLAWHWFWRLCWVESFKCFRLARDIDLLADMYQ